MSQIESQAALAGERLTEGSNAALAAAFQLMGRRSQAFAEFWQSVAVTWDREALLSLQLGYLTRMADDYAGAVSDALTPWSQDAAAVGPLAEPATPPVAAAIEPRVAPEPASFAEAEPPKPAKPGKRSEASAPADERHLGGHDGEELDVRA
jgi:hypothetical protein